MYVSLRKISKKYDLHPDTIRKKKLTEGVHFIRIGKLIRYHEKNMHDFLVQKSSNSNIDIEKFLLD